MQTWHTWTMALTLAGCVTQPGFQQDDVQDTHEAGPWLVTPTPQPGPGPLALGLDRSTREFLADVRELPTQTREHARQVGPALRHAGQTALHVAEQWLAPAPLLWAPVHEDVVVLAQQATDTMGNGHFRVVSRAPVDVRQGLRHPVPAPARVGDVLHLYAGTRQVCTARIDKLALRVAYRLVETTVLEGDDEGAASADFAKAAWHHPMATPMLVGELRTLEGRCHGADWARSASLPQPKVVKASQPGKAWQDVARRLLRKTEAWHGEQDDWQHGEYDDGPHRGRWDDDGEWQITLVRTGDGAWVYAQVQAGVGCGSFWGVTGALWHVTGDLAHPAQATWTQRGTDPLADRLWETRIVGAVDLDGDGQWELLLPAGRVRGDLKDMEQLNIPEEFICPC